MWAIMFDDLQLNAILSNFAGGNYSGRELVRKLKEVNRLASALVYAEIKERGVESTRDIVKMAWRRRKNKFKQPSLPDKVEIPMMDSTSPSDILAVTVIGRSS
jgi:hypothetical protein